MSHMTRALVICLLLAIVGIWDLPRRIDARVMGWAREASRIERMDAANMAWASRVYSSPIYFQPAYEDEGCPPRARCGWYGGVLPDGRYDEMIVFSR